MIALLGNQFVLLAESDWSRLIGVIVIVGFWIISGVAKMWTKNASGGDDETSQAVELAKKYAAQKRAQQPQRRSVRNNEFTSDWDRRQELKRQRMAQLHERGIQPPKPVKMPVVTPIPESPRPKPAVTVPEFKPVPQSDRTNLFNRQQQQNIKTQPPRPVSVPRTSKAAGKKRAVIRKKTTTAVTTAPSRSLHVLLKDTNELRSAVLLKEILDKPIALREEYGFSA